MKNDDRATYITAEIGVNAGLDWGVAKQLIDHAHDAGANAVKFQMWHPDRFPDLAHLRTPELSLLASKEHTEDLGMDWYCTPFDLYSIGWLAHIGMTQWKVPSGMITNLKFLRAIIGVCVSTDRIHMSTGGATAEEVSYAYNRCGGIPYHCVTCYPAPLSELNLAAIRGFLSRYGVAGYSDHSGNPIISPLAVAAGATHLEVHLTLDKSLPGPDHRASLTPDEFTQMVKWVREVEGIMGSGEKVPADCELETITKIRERMAL